MLHSIIEWWAELPWWLRIGVALILIGVSTVVYLISDRIWIWGWVVGALLLFIGGPSQTEKRGYRF